MAEPGTSTTDGPHETLGAHVFAGLLALVLIAAVWMAFGFGGAARTAPLVIGVPVAVLAVVNIVQGILRARVPKLQEQPQRQGRGSLFAPHLEDDEDLDVGGDANQDAHSWGVAFGWLAVLVILFFTVGFLVAIPLYMVGFLRFYGRESWVTTVIMTAVVMALTYFFFMELLQARVFPGYLPRLLGF